MRFNDKIVVITGGGSGIGKAAVQAFLQEGAKVAVFDYRLESHAEDNENYVTFEVDVRRAEQIQVAVEKVVEKWGKIDVLVNNAGIEFVAPLEETSEESWDLVLDNNLKGIFLVTKSVLPFIIISEKTPTSRNGKGVA